MNSNRAQMTAAQYARFERVLARAMRAEDPVAALTRAARDRRLGQALRALLAAVDPDGVRLSALLIARLRFERLLRGCPEAEVWFDRDPEEFAAAFKRYHAAVAPTAFYPAIEAKLFRRWLASP
jgi:hypothetical protein